MLKIYPSTKDKKFGKHEIQANGVCLSTRLTAEIVVELKVMCCVEITTLVRGLRGNDGKVFA